MFGAKACELGIKGAYYNFFISETSSETKRTEFGMGSWSIFLILTVNYFSPDSGGQNAAVEIIP